MRHAEVKERKKIFLKLIMPKDDNESIHQVQLEELPRVPETFTTYCLAKKGVGERKRVRVRGSDFASEVKNILSDWFGEGYSSSVDV